MTTNRNDKSNTNTDVRSSLPPAIYNIQYPNSHRGMFSLRAPFKNFYENQSQEKIYIRNSTPTVAHPKYLHMDQNRQEQPYFQQYSQQDAQTQCSLIDTDSRDGIAVRRHQTYRTEPYNNGYLSPRYRVQLNLQPTQPNIYEVWDIDTPPPRSIPINEPIKRREPSIRVRSSRLVDIESLSEDDSDSDDYLVYAHYPPRTYYPPNVRMVCVSQDANTIYF